MLEVTDEKGMVYVTAVAMVIVLMTMGLAFLEVSREGSWLNRNFINSMKAFYAAESGIQHGIAELRQGIDIAKAGDTVTATPIGSVNNDGSSFFLDDDNDGDNDYSVNWSGTLFSTTGTLTSQGEHGGAQRTIEVNLTVTGVIPPRTITVNEWRGHP